MDKDLLLGFVILVLLVAWAVLPFLLMERLNRIVENTKRTADILEQESYDRLAKDRDETRKQNMESETFQG